MKKEKIKEFIIKNKIKIILCCIFVLIFILNLFTPLIADDYTFFPKAQASGNVFISKLKYITNFQINYYLNWTGRTVAHTLGQLLLLFPKIVFDILNSFMFTYLVWLMYSHAKKDMEDNILILTIIPILMWFIIPSFGQIFIWIIGSVNYLWTTVIVLSFLLFYRKNIIKKDNILKIILMFLFGIIAGWTNENISFALIVSLICFIIIDKINKEKISKWKISGLIGNIVGFIILIIAPGNYARLDEFKEETSFLMKIFSRIVDNTNNLVNYLLPIIIISIILISILIYKKEKIPKESLIYYLASFLGVYAMTLSPTFPERAWSGICVLAIIGTMILLFKVLTMGRIFNFILFDFLVLFLIIGISQYLTTFREIKSLNDVWNWRESYIESEKAKGNFDIVIPYYKPVMTSHNPNYEIADIVYNSDIWPNKDIADYYGLKSIRMELPTN